MAEEAFVLVTCKSGEVEDVMDKVKDVKNVKEAYAITGTHDIIAFCRGFKYGHSQECCHGRVTRD